MMDMPPQSDLYREGTDSILLRIFGKSPQTKIMDLFLDNPYFEFTRMELVETLGMAKITVYRTIPIIESSGMVIPTRKIGKTQLYRLNADSDAVINLRKVIRGVSLELAKSELEEIESQTRDTRLAIPVDGSKE